MNILVTGGAGFIGSHITDALIELGHRVVIIDNLSSGKKENINVKAKFFKMDIRDKKVGSVIESSDIETVIHLAAQMDVRRSVEDPIFDADVNILGTLNVLQACVKSGVGRFVFTSSGGVMYGESDLDIPAPDEKKAPYPLSPYGDSKLAVEYYLNFYREVHGLKTTVLRFGNVYGPRQDPHGEAGVVAIFIGAMLDDKPLYIFGNGEQRRDYIFVSDVVEAVVKVIERGGDIYNIGTGISETVNRIFEILRTILNKDIEPEYKADRPGELFISSLDIKKAEKELDWQAQTDLEQGLLKTVDYFKNKCKNNAELISKQGE